MKLIPYFAYGSNMLLKRLQERCKSVRMHCLASAPGYELAFIKKSRDGSGKATILETKAEDARVHGVVFHLSADELAALDKFEGRGAGYDRRDDFRVEIGPNAEPMIVSTYIGTPDHLDRKLQAYDWYLNLVIAGAEENGLPEACRATLRTIPSIPDPDDKNPNRIKALALLAALKKTAA